MFVGGSAGRYIRRDSQTATMPRTVIKIKLVINSKLIRILLISQLVFLLFFFEMHKHPIERSLPSPKDKLKVAYFGFRGQIAAEAYFL